MQDTSQINESDAACEIVTARHVGIINKKKEISLFLLLRVLGHELSGIIEYVGEPGSGIQSGDQVAIMPYDDTWLSPESKVIKAMVEL